jgi:hypothetical protein
VQGDYRAAQPLYERALKVYEATYGSNHQEVAHTLTDLAVLHLEQVGGCVQMQRGGVETRKAVAGT